MAVGTGPWRLMAPLLLVLAACAACTSGGDSADAGSSGLFLPSTQSFDNFQTWSNAPASAKDDAGDGLHGLGPLRVYWNQSPPHGSTSFPVGTIIVKETEETDVTVRTVFAMVKVGGGYNEGPGGAKGWEWFSLHNNDDGSVTVLWSGIQPLAGESYANQSIGDCNGCHSVVAAENDYVWDSALQLSSF
jgi:hypothetical protein